MERAVVRVLDGPGVGRQIDRACRQQLVELLDLGRVLLGRRPGAVEPEESTRSLNRTVSWRRSASIMRGASAAVTGPSQPSCDSPRWASDAPQAAQKRARGGDAVPQAGHRWVCSRPQ
jgi:hypothetical protein